MLVWLAFGLVHVQAQTTREMNEAADKNFVEADTELNKVYRQLCDKLEPADVEELRVAQRAWVQYRDAEANFNKDYEARGGSMAGQVYLGVRARLTKERTTMLRHILKGEDW